jgi:STE24 endopeptidase
MKYLPSLRRGPFQQSGSAACSTGHTSSIRGRCLIFAHTGCLALLWCIQADAQSVTHPRPSATVAAFTRAGNLFWIAYHLWLLAIPAMFLFFGWTSGVRALCRRVARGGWFWTIALVAISYTLVTGLLLLPLSFLQFSLLRGFLPGPQGHSTPQWLVEQLGTVLTEAVAALILAWIPYWLLLRSPQRWWLWSSVLLSPIVLFILVLQPFWISPFTSQYAPLQDKALIAEMTEMTHRCGGDNAEIFVGGDSYQVAGLGPTKRILLGTRYAEEFSPSQLRFLIGHELGHNVNRDNWKAWAALSLALLAVFWLTHVIGNAAINWWRDRFLFNSLSDPASLPLIVFVLFAFMTLLTPLNMLWSRHIEHEADRFGLELTHENRAAALMFAGFEQTYLESPDPGWFALATRWNHPPAIQRIKFANDYHPWLDGKPLKYGEECRMQ